MRGLWVGLVVVAAAGCLGGGDSNGGGGGPVSTDPAVYCARYQEQCDYDVLQECLDDCTGIDVSEDESCWFKACGAATGHCDNEVSGDPQILTCAAEQGWYDACAELSEECTFCSDSANLAMCDDTVAAGIAADCVSLSAAFFDLPNGC